MSAPPYDKRSVCIPPGIWDGLNLVGQVSGVSISEVVRRAALAELARYGLGVVDGELVRNPALWEPGIQDGGGNPAGRRIQGGGSTAIPPVGSMPEEIHGGGPRGRR